ncbi:MAG: complex I subunit 5 family protein [Lachnospiraceae bacterium]|nr:complex I subunit 5 family protein [Lachnospiraceae bacterium]
MELLLGSMIFFPMVSSVVGYVIGKSRKNMRDYFADAAAGIEFFVALYLLVIVLHGGGSRIYLEISGICGMGLHFTLDGFRALYACIAAFMWFMTTLFSEEYFAHYRNRNRYYLFLLLTLGATEGVFLSADFYTVFIFFEIMSFTSYVWVAHDEKKESMRAANTYLAVAVIGGLVMLMGIFLLQNTVGTLMFDELISLSGESRYALEPVLLQILWAAGICMLFGFGAKAGAFPLHIWLPKAHPVAPAPASALLSGILTKAGMFGILILTGYLFLGDKYWGSMILVIGVCTMVTGAVLALFSVDLKRTLACSSVSQIGFILVGVGMSGILGAENASAIRGSLLHMVNHSIIKLVLFMAAGVVFMNVHKLNLNEIRGFGRKKSLLHFIFLMGALGISGVPLFNGYISKTLIHESIVEYLALVRMEAVSGVFDARFMQSVEWVFLISGGLTAAYMLKLYIALFWEKNNDTRVQEDFDSIKGNYMNKASASALTISAVLLPVMGLFPNQIMGAVADLGQGFMHVTGDAYQVDWFAFESLEGAVISLLIGAVLYLLVVRVWLTKKENGRTIYVNRWNKYLDLENLIYRPILLKALPFVLGVVCRVLDSLVDAIVVFLRKTVYRDSRLPHELEEGNRFTHIAGCLANGVERLLNATVWRKHPRMVDYEHKYALIHEELSEEQTIIGRSLSFGLLLFCVGLIITVVYLLV